MGIQERREREKEQRRNLILDAAEKVIFTRGINLATMDEVAEKAELSKGTLYLYFKSKEELYFGIAHRALTLLKDMFESAVKKQESGIDKIRAIGETYYEYSQKYANYFNIIVHYEMAQMDKTAMNETLMQCQLSGAQVMQVVGGAISAGIQDGSIRRDLDPVKTAYLLQGLSNGIIQLIAREKEHIQQFENFKAGELMTDFMNLMYHAMRSIDPSIKK